MNVGKALYAGFVILLILSQGNVSAVSSFHPVLDFRAPQSLFEHIQIGLHDIYADLETGSQQNSAHASLLQAACHRMDQLTADYDSLINTRRNHQIASEDKQFLQKMIDRIDALIEQLEGSDNQEQSDDVQEAYRSMKAACGHFKDRVA